MPSITKTLEDAAATAESIRSGLHLVEALAGANSGAHATTDRAVDALVMIGAIVKTLHQGMAGELDADEIHRQIQPLQAGLTANEAAARAEIDKRFPR